MHNKSQKSQIASMTDFAYQRIKELILRGKLSPGQKLLYNDLEARLKVSKTPIISALNRLESEGYVYPKKNVGYYIKEIDVEEVVQVLEAREILEVANLDSVIKNQNSITMKNLEKAHYEYVSYNSQLFDRKKSLLNSKFHVQLSRVGKNDFIIKYIEHLYEWIDLRFRFSAVPPIRVRQSEAEHGEIIKSIREKDVTSAKELLSNHLRAPVPFIIQNLKNEESISSP